MFAASSYFPKRHIWGFNQDDEKRLPVHIQPAPVSSNHNMPNHMGEKNTMPFLPIKQVKLRSTKRYTETVNP